MSKFEDNLSKAEAGKTLRADGGDLKGLEQQSGSKMLQEVGGEKKVVDLKHPENHVKLPDLKIDGIEGKADKKLSMVKEEEKGVKRIETGNMWKTKH